MSEVNNENDDKKIEEVEEVEEVEEILEDDTELVDNLKDQLLRLQADFMNYKRRSEEQKSSSMDYAVEKFALDLLPCVDNFERALQVESEGESFYEGVKLIYDELLKVLEKNKIETIDSKDQEFDPNLHHAVFAEETEEYEPDTVIEVLQKGYRLKDKVIRPAMVKVSK